MQQSNEHHQLCHQRWISALSACVIGGIPHHYSQWLSQHHIVEEKPNCSFPISKLGRACSCQLFFFFFFGLLFPCEWLLPFLNNNKPTSVQDILHLSVFHSLCYGYGVTQHPKVPSDMHVAPRLSSPAGTSTVGLGTAKPSCPHLHHISAPATAVHTINLHEKSVLSAVLCVIIQVPVFCTEM